MNILADENIPEVPLLFGQFGSVRVLPAGAIDVRAVTDVDVLLVRSVTRVDARLVAGSRVRFVGSATIGTDHVDEQALRHRGIAFAHAPGSNAESVVEYVIAALLELGEVAGRPVPDATLGIVGYGNIGSRLARRARALGMRVLVNDPPRAEAGERPEALDSFRSLRETLAESDAVSVHVPLVRTGRHPTVRLIDRAEIETLRPGAALINTSRGSVVAGDALREALGEEGRLRAVLDVFEGEPTPDPLLLDRLFLATPHIAGYSYDGKLNGALMLRQALCEHLGMPCGSPATIDDERFELDAPRTGHRLTWLRGAVRQMYDIRSDDLRMRALIPLAEIDRGAAFSRLRKDYPRRRSFDHFQIAADRVPPDLLNAVTGGLHVRTTGTEL